MDQIVSLIEEYLGVHCMSDVAAGYAAGGLWLCALITGAETIRRGRKRGPGSPRHGRGATQR